MTLPVETLESSLFAKLDRDDLEPEEVIEGVRECFIISHRAFMQRRQPEMEVERIDAITGQLVDEVFAEAQVRPQGLTHGGLRQVITILDEQFNFAAEPEVASVHAQVIGKLLRQLPKLTMI